jgi:hypothetical protein
MLVRIKVNSELLKRLTNLFIYLGRIKFSSLFMAGSLSSVVVVEKCCIRLYGSIPVADIRVGLNSTSSNPYVPSFLFVFLLLLLLLMYCLVI